MNIVLLSGGSGKRLWPLSNDTRSKQFIKIFKTCNNSYESMVQRVYRQLQSIDPDANITIATSKSQVSAIQNQLGSKVSICIEPCRRDTFPAIALASTFLHDVKGMSLDEPIVVCPVDPYVNTDYFETIKALSFHAKESSANITLMGIEPTYPSEKYGYIIPRTKDIISKVDTFKEKPDKKKAEQYIMQGALWNGGVFAFCLGYLIKKAHELIDFIDYEDLLSKYDTLDPISFDYAVVEKEKCIEVIRYAGQWKDLGTWNTLTEAMVERHIGRVIFDERCENVNVINELDIPVLCMGLNSVVVAASPDGILISDKESSSYIKPYVETIDQQIMYAEKSWGSYRVIDIDKGSMTIKIVLNPGERMHYHSHERRDEMWTVVSGTGRTIIDGIEKQVTAGDVITMQAGCRHTIIADTELHVIEVQIGEDISVQDKIKYELEKKDH